MRILVVSSDPMMRLLLKTVLEGNGYETEVAEHREQALEQTTRAMTEFVVCCLDLEAVASLETIAILSRDGNLPLIVLTDTTDKDLRVRALEYGADDCLLNPFHPSELLARINVVVRRVSRSEAIARQRARIEVAPGVVLDCSEQAVLTATEAKPLSATEFRLLHHFATNRGMVLNRERLIAAAWGHSFEGESREVDVYVSYLRRKLEQDSRNPRFLVTVRGVGYMLKR